MQIKGKTIKNTPYLQTNKAISQLLEKFAQMCNEVLNSVNVLIQVNNVVFELQENIPQEPSLTSTNAILLTQTQTINSSIQNNTNELKQLILNLQKQFNAL